MNIATSPTREKYPLHRDKILKKALGSIIGLLSFSFWFILIGMLQILFGALGNKLPFANSQILYLGLGYLFLLAIVFAINGIYQTEYFKSYYYNFESDYLVIRKGVFTPSEVNTQYEKIQDVYVDQDLLDRVFGLYDVHFSSAGGGSSYYAHIDGLKKAEAEGLKAEILQILKEKSARFHTTGSGV